MSASLPDTAAPDGGLSWRWPVAVALVLALHGAAFYLLERTQMVEDPVAPVEAILLDLAPAAPPAEPAPAPPPPAPPAQPPTPTPPPEPPVQAEPLPVEPPIPLPPPPIVPVKPEVVLPRPRPPRPVARPRPKLAPPPTPIQTEAPPLRTTAEPARPAPPSEAAPSHAAAVSSSPSSAAASANWASLLAAHLRRFRHYPPDAERRGMTGVVVMRFSIDAGGHIVAASMVRSSGHDVLDEEAEAWLRRAQPLPPPPPDKVAPAQLVVPLQFSLD